MILDIDFSLFSSPTKAYARISGNILIDAVIHEGDGLRILSEVEGDWFSGVLNVISLTSLQDESKLLVGLQDVVAQTQEDAARLCMRLEQEAGLFCDFYK